MKIAIPVVEEKLSMHFGHCKTFAIIDVDEDSKKILKTENLVPPPHEPGVLPKWLGELNVNVIITGGMGQMAQNLFNQNNIKVILGVPSEKPEKIVEAYMNGTLTSGANACDH